MIYNYIPIQIGGYYKVTGPEISYQYDELQFLVLTGVQLPAAFQVDFCNEGDTSTITMVGTNRTVQIPDEYLLTGKRIKAYIVLTKNQQPSDELVKEIQDYVKNHTAPYKYPRQVEFIPAMPKTVSGKIRRTELRNMSK